MHYIHDRLLSGRRQTMPSYMYSSAVTSPSEKRVLKRVMSTSNVHEQQMMRLERLENNCSF